MLELADDNVTIWLGGRGVVTSFENWNPTAADVQGMEGSYCRCKNQRERVWGELWDPCFVRDAFVSSLGYKRDSKRK